MELKHEGKSIDLYELFNDHKNFNYCNDCTLKMIKEISGYNLAEIMYKARFRVIKELLETRTMQELRLEYKYEE